MYISWMRIIAGSKRGLKLLSPEGEVSRPIIDRVKESLFSVLYGYDLPAGAVVADLFSGVGSLGLEALSRGAKFVTFVEADPQIAAVLKKNIERGGFVERSEIVRANAFEIGAPIDSAGQKYRLVFVDPPYKLTRDVGERSQLAGLMEVLAMQVADDGFVVVRTEKKTELPEGYGVFEVFQRRSWGSMNIAFLRKEKILNSNIEIRNKFE